MLPNPYKRETSLDNLQQMLDLLQKVDALMPEWFGTWVDVGSAKEAVGDIISDVEGQIKFGGPNV